MGFNIVLAMFCVLSAFLMASLFKAHHRHGRTWARSVLIALESPTCFLDVCRMYMFYAWYGPKKQWGELPDIWSKISMMLWIVGDCIRISPQIHSITIGAMVELTLHKELHTIGEVLHKNGVFVLSE